MEFSRDLICTYDKAIRVGNPMQSSCLKGLREDALISQFVAGAQGVLVRLELKRLQLSGKFETFEEMREHARKLLGEIDSLSFRQGAVPEVVHVLETSTQTSSKRSNEWPATDPLFLPALTKIQDNLKRLYNRCGNCRQTGHRKRFCPSVLCFRCKRTGHIAIDCPKLNGHKFYR